MAVKNTWTTGERVNAADLNAIATLLNLCEQAIANIGELADPGLVGGPLLLTDTKSAARAVIEAVGTADIGTLAALSPTGTANETTFLRGDGAWTVPPGGGGGSGGGENHYLVFDAVDGWPPRPEGSLPVIWVGGDAPDDQPEEHETGDVWIPATGDNIDLGPVLEALQLTSITANRIPWFPNSSTAGLLELKTSMSTPATDSALLTEAGIKTYVDKLLVSTKTADYSFIPSDCGKVIEYNSVANGTFTLNSGVLEYGDVIEIRSINTGILTVAGTGVVSAGNRFKLSGQWSGAALHCRAAGSYVLAGDLMT